MTATKYFAAAALMLCTLPAFAEDAMSSSSAMAPDAMGAMSSDAMAPDTMAPDAMAPDAMGAMGGDAMMMMTKGGEVVAIMADGHMGTAMLEGDKLSMTIGMSAALDHCVMFITGADGKVYQVDTKSAEAQAECEAIAK